MKKRKVVILLAILAAAALAVLLLLPQGQHMPEPAVPTASAESMETGVTEAEKKPESEESNGEGTDEPATEQPFLVQITEDDPSIAYVLVRMPNMAGLLPLPTEGEYKRIIRRKMNDGTEAINVVHLTTNGVWMEEANCEGHDCIYEGEVTLENREERVLWNMIICLPHELSLELITREEALAMLGQ